MELRRSITNSTDNRLLVLVEPWGEDYWLHPGETIELRAETNAPGDDFEVMESAGKYSVWASAGMDDVAIYMADARIKLGHQRPDNWPLLKAELQQPTFFQWAVVIVLIAAIAAMGIWMMITNTY